jgi:hypothetical protein
MASHGHGDTGRTETPPAPALILIVVQTVIAKPEIQVLGHCLNESAAAEDSDNLEVHLKGLRKRGG